MKTRTLVLGIMLALATPTIFSSCEKDDPAPAKETTNPPPVEDDDDPTSPTGG